MLHFTGGVLRSIHCFPNSIFPITTFQKLNSMIGKRLLSTYDRSVPGWHISQPSGTARQVYVTDHQPSASPLLCLQHRLGHTLIETILQWSLTQPIWHCAVWEVEVASQISTVSGSPVKKKKHTLIATSRIPQRLTLKFFVLSSFHNYWNTRAHLVPWLCYRLLDDWGTVPQFPAGPQYICLL